MVSQIWPLDHCCWVCSIASPISSLPWLTVKETQDTLCLVHKYVSISKRQNPLVIIFFFSSFFFFFFSTLSETSPRAVQHTPRAQFQYCYSSFYDHQDQGLDLMGKGTGGSACLQYPTLPYSKGRLQWQGGIFSYFSVRHCQLKNGGQPAKECGSSNQKSNVHRMWFWWKHGFKWKTSSPNPEKL